MYVGKFVQNHCVDLRMSMRIRQFLVVSFGMMEPGVVLRSLTSKEVCANGYALDGPGIHL